MSPPPAPPGPTRAALPLALALGLRLLRERLLLRALVWPGALVALALVGSAGLVAWLTHSPRVAVDDPALVAPLEAAGFAVLVRADPAAALAAGEVRRATYAAGDSRVLALSVAGREGLRAEAALRTATGAGWLLQVPPPPGRSADLDLQSARLAGLIAVLFALHGVVLGAGALVRDRDQGVLEVELSLPVPPWAHGLARQLAPTLALGGSLLATLWLIEALIGLPAVGTWWLTGACAGAAAVSLGTALVTGWRGPLVGGGRGEGLSGPLSRGLGLATGLLGLGWAWPSLGRHLPIASLAAFAQAAPPSLLGPPLSALLVGLVAWRFGEAAR